ncbi:unnamed protein product, partial [Onchocerca ochengi]
MSNLEAVTMLQRYSEEDAEKVFDMIKEKNAKEVLQILKSKRVPLNHTDK